MPSYPSPIFNDTQSTTLEANVSGSTVVATGGSTFRTLANRAADVANVLDFGADPTGVADSTTSFQGALALSLVVYVPKGTYRITNKLVVGAGRTFYGDGRTATNLVISSDFSSTATGVLSLVGRELDSPIVRDMRITFTQTTTQTLRANFRTLAAGGNLTTGIKYPPAIILTTANRFRILNVTVAGAWDGIINAVGNTIGGYIIDNVEMGSLNVGLSLDNQFDFGHLKSYHFWIFGFSSTVSSSVYSDGQNFAAKFGVNGTCQALFSEDFCTLEARVSIDNTNSWVHFANLGLDGTNASLEVNNCAWVEVVNMYTSAGSSTMPQVSMTGEGILKIVNQFGGGWFNLSGPGQLLLDSVFPLAQQTTTPLISQSDGILAVRNSVIGVPGGLGPWTTVPVIQSTGGITILTDNWFGPGIGGSTQPGISITTDNAQNDVHGNQLNGWAWTPPGTLGAYGLNSDMISPERAQFGSLTLQSLDSTATSMNMIAHAGQQRAMVSYTDALLRWAFIFGSNTAESGSNAGSDILIENFDDGGNFLGTALSITRSNGEVLASRLKAATFGLNIGTPLGRQTVTGSRASGAALVSLLTALAAFELITDSTSA